jgi:hypothetical protein
MGFAGYLPDERATGFPVSVDLIVTPNPCFELGASFETPIMLKDPPGFVNGALFARGRF